MVLMIILTICIVGAARTIDATGNPTSSASTQRQRIFMTAVFVVVSGKLHR